MKYEHLDIFKPDHRTFKGGVGCYVYRIRNTQASSQQFGACEMCGKHVSEVHYQVEGRVYERHDGVLAVTHHRCRSLFGHRECLEAHRQQH